MTKFKLLLSSALVLGAFSGAALAENVDASDPEALAALITEIGYPAVLKSADDGSLYIELDTGDGISYANLIDCTDGKDCQQIEFNIFYDMESGSTLEMMDEWNKTHLFPSAYLDSEGDPGMRYFLNMSGGGVTRDNFTTVLHYWAGSIAEFKGYLNI